MNEYSEALRSSPQASSVIDSIGASGKPLILIDDADRDIRHCEDGIKYLNGNKYCFANDDYLILNLGKNIHCTCFVDNQVYSYIYNED